MYTISLSVPLFVPSPLFSLRLLSAGPSAILELLSPLPVWSSTPKRFSLSTSLPLYVVCMWSWLCLCIWLPLLSVLPLLCLWGLLSFFQVFMVERRSHGSAPTYQAHLTLWHLLHVSRSSERNSSSVGSCPYPNQGSNYRGCHMLYRLQSPMTEIVICDTGFYK